MKRIVLGLLSFVVLCGLVVLSVELVVFDKGFYASEYSKLNTAQAIGIQEEDLMKTTTQLLEYVKGNNDDLTMRYDIHGFNRQVFSQKEIDHMVDVRDLYLTARNVRRMGMMVLLGLLAYGLIDKTQRHQRIKQLAQSIIDSLIVMGAVVVFLGAFYLIDFNRFWTTFHELMFTNDLWLLDPRTDILIQMVPTQFFIDCVGRIMIYTAVSLVGALILGCWGCGQKKQLG